MLKNETLPAVAHRTEAVLDGKRAVVTHHGAIHLDRVIINVVRAEVLERRLCFWDQSHHYGGLVDVLCSWNLRGLATKLETQQVTT